MNDDFQEPDEPTLEEELAFYRKEHATQAARIAELENALVRARTQLLTRRGLDRDSDNRADQAINVILGGTSPSSVPDERDGLWSDLFREKDTVQDGDEMSMWDGDDGWDSWGSATHWVGRTDWPTYIRFRRRRQPEGKQ